MSEGNFTLRGGVAAPYLKHSEYITYRDGKVVATNVPPLLKELAKKEKQQHE